MEPDELIGTWTLTGTDWDLIANKAGATRLGFAVMLMGVPLALKKFPTDIPLTCDNEVSLTVGDLHGYVLHRSGSERS